MNVIPSHRDKGTCSFGHLLSSIFHLLWLRPCRAGSLRRSAGFQPAVSPISNRQGLRPYCASDSRTARRLDPCETGHPHGVLTCSAFPSASRTLSTNRVAFVDVTKTLPSAFVTTEATPQTAACTSNTSHTPSLNSHCNREP